MGNSDSFSTKELEKILWKLEFINKPDNQDDEDAEDGSDDENRNKKKYSSIFGGGHKSGYDSSED